MPRRALKIKWNAARRLYEPVLIEEHVLREIVERLWMQARIKMWRINQPVGGKVRQNEPGIPDLMGWIPVIPNAARHYAIPLFIEVKRPGGARRPAQTRFIEEAKAGGCIAFFAESFYDVAKELAQFGVALSV